MSRIENALRRLDDRLGIDHRGRGEWAWLGPLLTLVGTVALVVVTGIRSDVGVAVYVPIALIVAVAMTGMSIAYMTPVNNDEAPPDDHGPTPEPAPQPPPWYRRLLAGHAAEEPTPQRREPREPAGRR